MTYHHILIDRHAALNARGAVMEGMYPGKQALAALGWSARMEIAATIWRERCISSSVPLATGDLSSAYGQRIS
ncbi:hypothetical protein ACSBLW_07460 [Thioclava sp. FR2]|uniref:hypothetical protein n=1 Tax=Thioclava sp. FR2 TaxID=3445780 RepID=UPI003EBF0759